MATGAAKYQDVKIARMGALVGMAAALLMLFVWAISRRDEAKPIFDSILAGRGHYQNGYDMALIVLPVGVVLFLWGAVEGLMKTPQQDLNRLRALGRRIPTTLSDAESPYFRMATWRYVLHRLGLRP